MSASFADDAPKEAKSDILRRITSLAESLVTAKERTAALTAELKTAQAAEAQIEKEDLPELMRELGVTEIKLENGAAVKVVEEINCGITEERRVAAHDWLKANGFGGLIKTDLNIEFGRDEIEEAMALQKKLAQLTNHPVIVQEGVHWQTLKAFIKEQRALGKDVPADLFGIWPWSRAKYTPPKPTTKKARK